MRRHNPEGYPQVIAARPMDDFDALSIGIDLVSAKRPELSQAEIMDTAILMASSIVLLEGHRASRLDMTKRVDDVFFPR